MSSYSHNRDFLFCHLCGTLLRPPSGQYAECPLCKTKRDRKYMIGKEISYTITAEEIRRELGINTIEDEKLEDAKVNKTCEKCGHGEATYITLQNRSADEGQTTIYTCTKCKTKFKES